MGFTTTMTTQLKSVGDAVQIVALIIGGSIILNVPNCTFYLPNLSEVTYTLYYSPSHHSHHSQHSVHRGSWVHGLPSAIEHMGKTGVLLASQLPVCWLHHITHYNLL